MKIAPSILSANFAHLQEDIDKVKNADIMHIDVMDGHFVENITIGPVVIKDIKTDLLKEAHLMIAEPGKFVEPFVKAGVQRIIFHAETVDNPEELIKQIKSHGIKAGASITENIVMLGALTALTEFPLEKQLIEQALVTTVPQKAIEINKKAFQFGFDFVKNG